jgi:hypothetical protein
MTAPATLAASSIPLKEENRSTTYAVVLPFRALLLGGIGLFSRKVRKRWHGCLLLGGSVMLLFAVLGGCGGGGSQRQIPQNYNVTVNATSGSLKHSTTVTLTVQ